jgi:hypothetical protein
LHLLHVVLDLVRELVDGVLRVLTRLRVGLAEILQVADECVAGTLDVVFGALQAILRRVALE